MKFIDNEGCMHQSCLMMHVHNIKGMFTTFLHRTFKDYVHTEAIEVSDENDNPEEDKNAD